jgi:hypothetical protein
VLNLVEPYARVHAHVLGSRPQMQQERVEMVQALRDADEGRVRELIEQSIRTARVELEMSMGDLPLSDPGDL